MVKKAVRIKGVFDPSKNRTSDKTGLPWSHAITAKGQLLFIAGQSPRGGPKGNIVYEGDIAKQTRQALSNLKKVLESAGGSIDDVTCTIWFTTSIAKFYSKGASQVRKEFFKPPYPTSTLVEVKRFASRESMVEVQAFAVLDN
ncbi:MAG: RidA family protein [Thaumarchaeota archaeon]|nr:RidA family protein [Nitrososphaerota archaeon]